MKLFLFVVLILIIVFMYFYYERKLSIVKKKLLLTSNQFNTIKKIYKNTAKKNQNLKIKFIVPENKTAIINNKATVFLAPTSDSPILNVLNIKMEVKILDCAIINNDTWFYVNLPMESNYNCRGWVNKKEFSFFYSVSQEVSNSYNK